MKNFNDKTWFGSASATITAPSRTWSSAGPSSIPNTISYSATVEDPKVLHQAVHPEHRLEPAAGEELPADRRLLLHPASPSSSIRTRTVNDGTQIRIVGRAGARPGLHGGGRPAGSPGQERWSTTVPVITSGAWTGKRLADGQPYRRPGLLVEHHRQPRQLHRPAGRRARQAVGNREPAAQPAGAQPRLRSSRRPRTPVPAGGARAAEGLRSLLHQPDQRTLRGRASRRAAGRRACPSRSSRGTAGRSVSTRAKVLFLFDSGT